MQISLFLHSTHSAVTVMNNHFHKKVQGNEKFKLQKKNKKQNTRTEHKLKQNEIDYAWKFISKKGVAKSRKRKSESMIEKGQQKSDLKRKMERESIQEKSQKRSKKYRDSKEIPTTPEKFQKFVTKACNVAKNSPRKTKIITDTMATHNFGLIMSRPTLSILQLQSL